MNTREVISGLDTLVNEGFSPLHGLKVAILSNQASVDKNFHHIIELAQKNNVNIVKLFAPEHGIFGALQDMEHVGELKHKKLNIPIISLYGDNKESLKLSAKELNGVDVLLCDLQDIGARYYTFHCTIAWAMKACAESQTKLMVIDRPNPINAKTIEGNLVKKNNFSFVGAYPLPNRHGFTMGEIIDYVKNYYALDFDHEIVEIKNYSREKYFDEINLSFIAPSANMPTVNTAVVYPGACLIEGTNLSEGRGTCTPFEFVGAPFIECPQSFADRLNSFDFSGVTCRPVSFRPMFQKHANKNCNGVFVHVTDRTLFKPLRFFVALIKEAYKTPGFDWRREPYEFEYDRLAIDLLLGDDRISKMIEKDAPLKEIFDLYDEEEKMFLTTREQFLRY